MNAPIGPGGDPGQQPPNVPPPGWGPGPHPPFTGYPTGWPPAGPPPRRRRWWLVLIVLAVAVLVAGGVFVVRGNTTGQQSTPTTTPSSAPAASPVAVSALDGLLLDAAEVAKLIGAPTLVVTGSGSQMGTGEMVDNDCNNVTNTVQHSAYAGTGYTALRWQNLRESEDPDAQINFAAGQAVVSFPRADRAADYFRDAVAAWQRCGNRSINERMVSDEDAADNFWFTGPVTESDGVLQISLSEEGGGGWTCYHGLSTRNNIVIDVIACGYRTTEAVVAPFIAAITDHVDAQQ